MKVSRPRQASLRKSTGILVAAPTKWQRDEQHQSAEEIFAAQVTRLARGRYDLPIERPTLTFTAFAEWYRTNKLPQHRGQERDLEMLERLAGFFGRDDLTTISRARVEEYLTKRTQIDKKKPGTANREVDLLKAMLAAAVPEYLPSSPIAGMRRLRTAKIKKRFLSVTEEQRLLAELDPRDQALFVASVDSLLRLHNVIDLRRDEDHGTYLEVDTKTGSHRTPVSKRLRKALDALPVDERHPEYYFWWRRQAKTQRDQRGAIRTMLKRACERAGIPYGRAIAGITFHTSTRGSGATRMLRKGVDPKTVQEIGHWASLEQMSDYLTTDDKLQRAAVNLIGQCAPGVPRSKRKGATMRHNTQRPRKPAQTTKGRPAKRKRPNSLKK
jgi:site-specific recombinase XerD